eukprot:scaffold16967_cov113-Isochrysis_galbana.AAC.4
MELELCDEATTLKSDASLASALSNARNSSAGQSVPTRRTRRGGEAPAANGNLPATASGHARPPSRIGALATAAARLRCMVGLPQSICGWPGSTARFINSGCDADGRRGRSRVMPAVDARGLSTTHGVAPSRCTGAEERGGLV